MTALRTLTASCDAAGERGYSHYDAFHTSYSGYYSLSAVYLLGRPFGDHTNELDASGFPTVQSKSR